MGLGGGACRLCKRTTEGFEPNARSGSGGGAETKRPVLSWSSTSILWHNEDGSTLVCKMIETSTDITDSDRFSRTVTAVEVVPIAGRVGDVYLARTTSKRQRSNRSALLSSKGKWGAWEWIPWLRQHRQEVGRARGRPDLVEMALDDKGSVVSHWPIENQHHC